MLRIPFEWFKFEFECFESFLNGSNLHLNALNLFRMVRICIRMIRISFEGFKFEFECFKSLSNDLDLHSNASNPFWVVRIWIRMLRIPLEWFEFAFECFKSLSSGSNLDLNQVDELVSEWVGKWPAGSESVPTTHWVSPYPQVLLQEESDNYDAYTSGERQEFLFRLFKHLALGGPVNQVWPASYS